MSTPSRYEPAWPDRPGTVTAAAVILFVSAGLGVLACGGINVLAVEAGFTEADRTALRWAGAVLGGAAVLSVVLGYHLLRGRQWARIVTITLAGLGILGSLVSVFAGSGSPAGATLASTCAGVIFNVVVIGLLSGARASAYFRPRRPGSPPRRPGSPPRGLGTLGA